MRVGLNKGTELTIAMSIKGLSPSITNKVDLQSYLSFDTVYNLAIKVKNQFKGIKHFQSPFSNWPPKHHEGFLVLQQSWHYPCTH